MKYFLTLMFILISTQLWAAENKQTYFCLSASDNSQKLLVLADIDGEQIGYLDTDEYKLNDENGVLVGPSTAGSSFFKLASGKLDLMSSAGMWSGVCHQFTSENAQALSNASKSGEVVVDTEVSDSSAVVSSSEPNACKKNPMKCTKVELCAKATFNLNTSSTKWRIRASNQPYVKEAKSRGLACNVKTSGTTSTKVKTCDDVPTRCTDMQLCFKASIYSGGRKAWRKSYSAKQYVANAKSRGLICGVSTTSSASNENGSCKSNPKACSTQDLCVKARKPSTSGYVWENGNQFREYVKEAKSRDLTCGVKTASSSSSSVGSGNCYDNVKACTDEAVCIVAKSRTSHKREAKARGLTCGVGSASSTSSSSSSSGNTDYILKSEFNKFSSYDRKRIQRHLKSKGYYKGYIDGTWGAKTQSALKAALDYSSSMSNRTWVKKELKKMISSSDSMKRCIYYPSVCTTQKLCERATFGSGSSKKFKQSADRHVKEAKYRQLKCGVNASSSSSSSSTNSSSSYSSSTTKKKKKTGFSLFGNRNKSNNDSAADYRKIISNPQYPINQALEICKAIADNVAYNAKSNAANSIKKNKSKSYNCTGFNSNSVYCNESSGGGSIMSGFLGALGDDLNSSRAGKRAYKSQMRACMAQNGYGLK